VNSAGHPSTLRASHPGNRNREIHGGYSLRRSLDEAAVRIADDLMRAPHTVPLDRLAAEEIAALVVQVDRIDARPGRAQSIVGSFPTSRT
jgi:hypothetical protein